MPIKSIKKLPAGAQSMFAIVLAKVKDNVNADLIAWEVVKQHYKPITSGRKSMKIEIPQITNDRFIDVPLGYATVDQQGEFLTQEFWDNSTVGVGVLKGDMEHLYDRKANGEYVDDADDYDGWVPMADRFWTTKDGIKMGRVEIPENHPFTPTFLAGWKSGKYSASVEYASPEEATV